MASSASGSSCSCVIVEEQWKRCMEILETAENNWLGHLRRRNNRNILSQGEIRAINRLIIRIRRYLQTSDRTVITIMPVPHKLQDLNTLILKAALKLLLSWMFTPANIIIDSNTIKNLKSSRLTCFCLIFFKMLKVKCGMMFIMCDEPCAWQGQDIRNECRIYRTWQGQIMCDES